MSVLAVLEEIRVVVESDRDVVAARQQGRLLMVQLGFSTGEATVVATAISELARNMISHAGGGEIVLTPVESDERCGLIVTARDEGDGIADIRQAMRDGFSTTRSLGLGLPGVKRLMDEFEIVSEVGRGTRVTVKKWMVER